MPFEVNQRVGDYEILGLLGVGGMGHVYRARNVISNRTEAMKVLLPDLSADRDLAVRFISEIRTLAGFDHPNIALLHTAFQLDNQLIMVMEYVEGFTLEQRAKQSPIPVPDVVEYISQSLSALAYAHSHGVIHRDIKPANLMITSHGVVKLMDFGIAKSAVQSNLTQPGTTIGSLYYMSPEQVRGAAIDARSDLYSMGVVLYELLAGRRPFEADSTFGILNKQLNTPPQPPIEINPDLPPQLNTIILKALAKAPEERFQTAEEFRNELKRFAGKAVTEPPSMVSTVAAPAIAATAVPVPATGIPTTQSPAWQSVRQPSVQPPPPPPMQPLAAAPLPFTPIAAQKSSGNRSVWIASGALAAVLALVAVAFALPRLLKTHASESATTTSQPAQPTVEITTPPPVTPVDLSTAPTPAMSAGNLATPANPVQTPTTNLSAPSGSPARNPQLASANNPGPKAQTNSRINPQMAVTANQPGPTPSGATAPPPAGPSAFDVEQLQDRYIQLDARAQAALNGVASIRRQQEATGLGLRGDIESADARLRSYMAAANQDVHGPRTAQAARDMDKAESEISILEKFLGR